MSKILLVEDERDLALAIAEWLGDEHHLVEIAAGDGKTAVGTMSASHNDGFFSRQIIIAKGAQYVG